VTMAREPVLRAADVEPGTHVNAVGFGGPQARELSGDLIAKASIFIDSEHGAAKESGNLHLARQDGHLRVDQKLTLLCDVLAGRTRGRQHPDEITVFDSLGIAIEDLACAGLVYARALEAGIGTVVTI
jgi:ornithine cyclodeaminase/alanine dehydrogenase-like protein (mu-crystallin family)